MDEVVFNADASSSEVFVLEEARDRARAVGYVAVILPVRRIQLCPLNPIGTLQYSHKGIGRYGCTCFAFPFPSST